LIINVVVTLKQHWTNRY